MTKKKTKYIVINPKPEEISSEIPMIRFHGRDWYPGDEFERPEGMSDYGWERLLRQGFIVEG